MEGASGVPVQPSKIVCVGRNYVAHASELGNTVPDEPLTFFKPPSALLPSGSPVLIPPDVGRVDFEGEIGLVVGTRAHRVPEADAWSHVSGVVAVNDVTARELQRKDNQWTRAKGFNTFCPVGNVVPAADLDPGGLGVVTRVNGELRQQGHAGELAFSIPYLIAFISHMMTLEPGDLIATGTPEGVGPLAPGDRVDVELNCGSTVSNPFEAGEPVIYTG
ncbi:MAG: fumarylacetoacetate hydrolase family protein [Gemmatimonadetes bacterium]|nr:fumarylacetoacetate hydrolase family protein [Gemmatimonadota bacterium]